MLPRTHEFEMDAAVLIDTRQRERERESCVNAPDSTERTAPPPTSTQTSQATRTATQAICQVCVYRVLLKWGVAILDSPLLAQQAFGSR